MNDHEHRRGTPRLRRSLEAAALIAGAVAVVGVPTSPAAAAGEFSVSPTTLSFPATYVGSTASRTITITNVSGVAQTPNFSGGAPNDATNFGGSQDCAGKTFAPGDSCTFTYTFEPASIGDHASTTTIGVGSDNFAISMSGTGLAPFTMNPTNLVFPPTAVGASSEIDVVVTNISPTALTPNFAGGAPFDPTNFGGAQDCAGVSIPGGGSCTFTYEYRPAAEGNHTSNTTVSIDDQNFAITMFGSTTGAAPATTAPTDTTEPESSTPTTTDEVESTEPDGSAPDVTVAPGIAPIPGPIVAGPDGALHGQVIAQGIVGFVGQPFVWTRQTLGPDGWPRTLADTPPMFLVATGPDGLLVNDPSGQAAALIDDGEAVFVEPGSVAMPLFDGATAGAEQITFALGNGPDSFSPGPGKRDVNLVSAPLAAGETVTIASPFPVLAVVLAGTVTAPDGSTLVAGSATAVGAGSFTSSSNEPATLLVATVGGNVPAT